MRTQPLTRFHCRQHGMAVLVMLLLLILGCAAFLVSELNSARAPLAADKRTTDALAKAKEALIAYAVTYYERLDSGSTPFYEFGFLPCPNLATGGVGEGFSVGSCGFKNINSIGKFPWRSLDLDAIRDGSGECLWYAVSGSYKSGTAKTDMLNDDTNGLFNVFDTNGAQLAGITPESRAVAVVIAPGAPVNSQNRTSAGPGTEICGGNYTPSDYLETWNGIDNRTVATIADTVDDFVTTTDRTTASAAVPFNDRLIYITQNDIWLAVKQRNDFDPKIQTLTSTVAQCLANYAGGGGSMPWAASVDLGDYRDSGIYEDTDNKMSGRLSDIVDASNVDNSQTGDVLTSCTAPGWTVETQTLWEHWKDHLFYALAQEYKPTPAGSRTCVPAPSVCVGVLDVATGTTTKHPAVVIFSRERLPALNQSRNVAPPDTEGKSIISNYLEAPNDTPNTGSSVYVTGSVTASFNDLVIGVVESLIPPVTPTPPPCGGMGAGMGGGMGCGGMGGGM